jgi:hypothetical protein
MEDCDRLFLAVVLIPQRGSPCWHLALVNAQPVSEPQRMLPVAAIAHQLEHEGWTLAKAHAPKTWAGAATQTWLFKRPRPQPYPAQEGLAGDHR